MSAFFQVFLKTIKVVQRGGVEFSEADETWCTDEGFGKQISRALFPITSAGRQIAW